MLAWLWFVGYLACVALFVIALLIVAVGVIEGGRAARAFIARHTARFPRA